MDTALPKRLASYIHETGRRALDNLTEGLPSPEEEAAPDALQALIGRWRLMSSEEKEDFVNRVAASVGEVMIEAALLPIGLKAGGKVLRSARKALKRSGKVKNLKAAEGKEKDAAKNKDALKRKDAAKKKDAAEKVQGRKKVPGRKRDRTA